MTLADFKALIVSADPKATRYFGADTGNYTVWAEHERKGGVNAENWLSEPVWGIRVERITKIEDDPMAEAIMHALENDEITVKYTIDSDPESKYIRHVFDCEVLE